MKCSFCGGRGAWSQTTTKGILTYGKRKLVYCADHMVRYYLGLR